MATQDSQVRNALYEIDLDTLAVSEKLDYFIKLEQQHFKALYRLMADNQELRDENARLRQQIQNDASSQD